MKYEHVTLNGISLLPGEPWFLIRGKDIASIDAVEEYFRIAESFGGIALEKDSVIEMFRTWQDQNLDKIKIPD